MDNVISVFPPHPERLVQKNEEKIRNGEKNGKNAKYYPTHSPSKTYLWRKAMVRKFSVVLGIMLRPEFVLEQTYLSLFQKKMKKKTTPQACSASTIIVF